MHETAQHLEIYWIPNIIIASEIKVNTKKPKLVILSLHLVDCRTQTCWSVDYLLQLFQVCSYSLQHRHRYSLGYLFSIFRKPLLFTIHGRISKWLQQTRVSNNAGPGAGPGQQPHNTPNQINYTQHFTLHYNHTFSEILTITPYPSNT